jgi:hypothetical protein
VPETKTDILDEFVIKNKVPDAGTDQPNRKLLGIFIEFLKERGQFIEKGDLKKSLTEKTTIKDKNKVPIEVTRCLVCSHEEFEVKETEEA